MSTAGAARHDSAGIDVDNVTAWFVEHVEGVDPPLHFRLIAGGRSNLTFEVGDESGNRYVLRRPPTSHVLPTAHDMAREARILTALADTDVPVPPVLGFCDDESVNQRPFYVMAHVDGLVVRDPSVAEQLAPEARRRAGEHLMDVLAAIHSVDPASVGLGDLGKQEGYIARQLKRWNSQFEASKLREVPLVTSVYERLLARIPEQGPATIVHGDYRLDNCILTPDGEVAAVLDWELCTLGDPLADLGLLTVYWSDRDDDFSAVGGGATTLEGFPRRSELFERYAAASGRDLGHLEFYVAFGYWKLACILDGVASRYAQGAMGDDGADAGGFSVMVERLAEAADAAVKRLDA